MTKKCVILNRKQKAFFLLNQKISIDFVKLNRKMPFFLFLFILSVFQSCNQPSQGCRDIRATNYDVSADEDCEEECCQFPELKIKFDHKIQQRVGNTDTLLAFKYNTSYILPVSLTDTFSFQKIKCYFSNFRLVNMDGEEVQVTNKIAVDLEGEDPDSITITDDIILFDAASPNYTLGNFDQPNTYQTLRFTVGLQSELLTTNPEIAPQGTVFTPDSINYETEFGYIPQKYVFFPEPSDTIGVIHRVFQSVPIEVSTDAFALVTGFDATLRMTMRYDWLFENIVFGSTDLADFRQKIVTNLPNAVTLDSLDQN